MIRIATKLDRLMWTWPATGFLPHCAAHDALAAETPVLIGGDDVRVRPKSWEGR